MGNYAYWTEVVKGKSSESLGLLLVDAAQRVASNPDNRAYVYQQGNIIDAVLDELAKRGYRNGK